LGSPVRWQFLKAGSRRCGISTAISTISWVRGIFWRSTAGRWAGVDWRRGYEFLDKELQQVVRDAELGRRFADKLVKVCTRDGKETWVLVHVEVQGQAERGFDERMYVYNYRLFDRYRVDVVSLAVLADASPGFHAGDYRRVRWGCEVRFRFPVVKLLELGRDWEALESSGHGSTQRKYNENTGSGLVS
jgi:hypothetical protein